MREPPQHLKKLAYILGISFSQDILQETIPIIVRNTEKLYLGRLQNTIHHYHSYGTQTKGKALHLAIDDIVTCGEKGNGQLAQLWYTTIQRVISDPKKFAAYERDSAMKAIVNYMTTCADISGVDRCYKTYYRQVYGRDIQLRRD